VAANTAQFSSGASFSEVETFRVGHPAAKLCALGGERQTALYGLIAKQGNAAALTDLKGATHGITSTIPPSVQAMLAKAGLVDGTDYQTVQLDGSDPTVHIAIPNIAGFPGSKSNEPGQLQRAGVTFTLFDP